MHKEFDSRLDQAWWVLRIGLGLGPFLAGLDKHFNLLANWTGYISPLVLKILPFTQSYITKGENIKRLRLMITMILPMTLVLACQIGAQAQTAGSTASSATTLRQDMRKLWTDHTVWTRDYIIAAIGDQPDASTAANRLMKNQEDIGEAVANYYGKTAGDKLTSLLKEHISIAVDLIKAAKAGDKAGQQQADGRWQKNAVDIADFLSKANPNWPKAALVDLMKTHLSTTTNEVVARLNKNWDEDVRAWDAVYNHILMMSDALSDGIIKQFPDKFRS